MTLDKVKLNTNCKIIKIKIENERLKTRLMELGLIEKSCVKVIKKSGLKKTFLVIFNSSCFTLKSNLAQMIEVEYA